MMSSRFLEIWTRFGAVVEIELEFPRRKDLTELDSSDLNIRKIDLQKSGEFQTKSQRRQYLIDAGWIYRGKPLPRAYDAAEEVFRLGVQEESREAALEERSQE